MTLVPRDYRVADAAVLFAAEVLDDDERSRIAANNRIDAFIRDWGEDIDGHPALHAMREEVGMRYAAEMRSINRLERAMAEHPFADWIDTHKGVGPKGIGRLLAAIGHPAVRTVIDEVDDDGNPTKTHQELRGLRQLWAYCGYHVVNGRAAKRKKGQKCNWSTTAKTRAYSVADSAFRQGDFRQVYLDRREATEDRDWTQMHKHNDAVRIVAKEILRSLWLEGRRQLGVEDGEAMAV